ncbi:MAG: hypothetical protein ABEJ93_03090 [Candidatus Nanohalobium sp.]
MNSRELTAAILLASVLTGLTAGIHANKGFKTFQQQEKESPEYALVFLYANNSRIDLSQQKYRSQSDKAFLKKGSANVVHVKGEATWKEFLDSLNISVNQQASCIETPEEKYCGNMTALLNGEEFRASRKIGQGDSLAVVVGENSKKRAEAYMELDLPKKFREREPGTRF